MPSLSDIFPGAVTVLNEVYNVDSAGAMLTLQVFVGYGQNANSFVHLNGQMIAGPGPGGSYTRSFAATLTNVKPGDTLTISTTVYDINPATDMTSVNVSINGNAMPGMQCEAPKSGSVPYYAYISFNKA